MDIRRLKELATRLVSDGRYERAEVLFRQMLTLAPRDANLWLRHAELLKRLDRSYPAVTSYRMAAQLLMDVGHAGRAVACLKLALELVPEDIDLVTDIIRFELRQRAQERAPRAMPGASAGEPSPDSQPRELPAPPIVEAFQAALAAGEELPPTAPLLALPMLPSSDERITEMIPEVNEPVPVPRASAPRIPLEVEAPLLRWPQVRRVSDHEIAIKASPFSHWVVMTAAGAIDVRFFEEYPVAEEAVWLEEPTEG
jgi:tetratricopeptide (TPR) repeat protein